MDANTHARPVFPHHTGDVSNLLNLLQDGYQRNDVAEETLVGSQSMGYSSEKVPIDKIFTKPLLIKADDNTDDASRQGTGAESERMPHIFVEQPEQANYVAVEDVLDLASRPSYGLRKSRRQSARVLVLGRAGSSKTMLFARKSPLEWSRGNLWPQIEFLFVLPLRQESVHKAKALHDLIQLERLGIIGSAKVEAVRSYIGDHWHRVCFILDALDEVKLDACSEYVQEIIRGKALTQAHVVVTSRPSSEALILDRDYPFKTRLELMGFGREEVAEYGRRVLKTEHAAEFLRQVNACPQLAALLDSPLNCVNACSVYRTDTSKSPATLPALYTALMNGVVRHAQGKLRHVDRVSTDWSEVDAELKTSANAEVASFAFTALAERITVFQDGHFERLELSQNGRELKRLDNHEDIALDHPPRFVSSGQIPEETPLTAVTSSAKREASSTSPTVAASSSNKDGPSSLDTLSSFSIPSLDEGKGKHEEDPWNHPMFGSAHGKLMEADPVPLRLHAFAARLITWMEQRELQAIQSPLVHNEKLIDYIRGGGLTSFMTFLEVLGEMGRGYDLVRRQLEKLLSGKTAGKLGRRRRQSV